MSLEEGLEQQEGMKANNSQTYYSRQMSPTVSRISRIAQNGRDRQSQETPRGQAHIASASSNSLAHFISCLHFSPLGPCSYLALPCISVILVNLGKQQCGKASSTCQRNSKSVAAHPALDAKTSAFHCPTGSCSKTNFFHKMTSAANVILASLWH